MFVHPSEVIYKRPDGKVLHLRTESGRHLTGRTSKSGTSYTKTELVKRASEHRRIVYGQQSWSDDVWWTARGVSHGLMNFVTQEGTWSWYTGWGGYKEAATNIDGICRSKRKQGAVMKAATADELNLLMGKSATAYARTGHGAFWTRGHDRIAYEWCHLAAHGHGGKDVEGNLVAATCYNNTEQMVIENVLYEYLREGLEIKVKAKLAKGTAHLAESIHYRVLLGGTGIVAFDRTMDCRRATQVSGQERGEIARDVRNRLNRAIAAYHGLGGLNPSDQWDEVEEDEYDEEECRWFC